MRIVKRVLAVLGWVFSILYVYLAGASLYDLFAPKPDIYCATPLLGAIVFLLFPLGFVMGTIIYRDFKSLRGTGDTSLAWLKPAKITRMVLGGLAMLSMAMIAVPIFLNELF